MNSSNVLGIEIPSTDPIFWPWSWECIFHWGSVRRRWGCRHVEREAPGDTPCSAQSTSCLFALFASATFLAIVRWAESHHLFVLGTVSFAWALSVVPRSGGAGLAGLNSTSQGWASHMFGCSSPSTWTTGNSCRFGGIFLTSLTGCLRHRLAAHRCNLGTGTIAWQSRL